MRRCEDVNRTTAGVLFCSERPVHISHIESSERTGHTMRRCEDVNRTTAGVLFCSERPVHISHIESSGTRS
ncbi:hypothetical protein J6590_007297 [Homalodisca vitripennis]|nr:hypothetical protein J6590_007297 [Homalodisca vitripennis]